MHRNEVMLLFDQDYLGVTWWHVHLPTFILQIMQLSKRKSKNFKFAKINPKQQAGIHLKGGVSKRWLHRILMFYKFVTTEFDEN